MDIVIVGKALCKDGKHTFISQNHTFKSREKVFRHDNYNEKFCQLAFVDLFDKDQKLLGNLGSIIYDELLKNNF